MVGQLQSFNSAELHEMLRHYKSALDNASDRQTHLIESRIALKSD